MVRKAAKRDIQAIIELLHQVDMVHHVIRPDLFKPNTTKYNEQELEALLDDDSKPVFVYDAEAPQPNEEVASARREKGSIILGHAFC
jgi:hypothetical protein